MKNDYNISPVQDIPLPMQMKALYYLRTGNNHQGFLLASSSRFFCFFPHPQIPPALLGAVPFGLTGPAFFPSSGPLGPLAKGFAIYSAGCGLAGGAGLGMDIELKADDDD